MEELSSEGEEIEENAICSQFQTNSAMKTMTNFTLVEFEEIFAGVEAELNAVHFRGRGRRATITPKDSLFLREDLS